MQMMMRHGKGFAFELMQRMTLYQILRGGWLVFRAVENARRHGLADESSHWARPGWRAAAGDAVCCGRPQDHDRVDRAARRLCIFAARKSPTVSAGEPVSALGCDARRAGRHCRAGRTDR